MSKCLLRLRNVNLRLHGLNAEERGRLARSSSRPAEKLRKKCHARRVTQRAGRPRSRVLLEVCCEGGTVCKPFAKPMLLVTGTDITVWVASALLALGIGVGKYSKWKARNQLVRELAAMDRERREKVLSRMNPAQAMEARQELMRRFNIF